MVATISSRSRVVYYYHHRRRPPVAPGYHPRAYERSVQLHYRFAQDISPGGWTSTGRFLPDPLYSCLFLTRNGVKTTGNYVRIIQNYQVTDLSRSLSYRYETWSISQEHICAHVVSTVIVVCIALQLTTRHTFVMSWWERHVFTQFRIYLS